MITMIDTKKKNARHFSANGVPLKSILIEEDNIDYDIARWHLLKWIFEFDEDFFMQISKNHADDKNFIVSIALHILLAVSTEIQKTKLKLMSRLIGIVWSIFSEKSHQCGKCKRHFVR